MLALVCNHIELNVHRQVHFRERYDVMHEVASHPELRNRKEALCFQGYRCRRPVSRGENGSDPSSPSSGGGDGSLWAPSTPGTPLSPRERRETLACRPWVRTFVSLVIVVCGVTLVLGCFLETFEFEFRGLASLLLGNNTKQPYSLVTVGDLSGLIQPEDSTSRRVGYYFLQAIYYVFAIAVPTLYLVVLLLLWAAPMTLVTQHHMMVWSETLAAWSAVDVFVLSIVVALTELPSYVQFIVGDGCDGINEIAKHFPAFAPDGDTHCFDVRATLQSGCGVLALAAVTYVTLSYTLTRICDRAIEERSRFYHHELKHSASKAARQVTAVTIGDVEGGGGGGAGTGTGDGAAGADGADGSEAVVVAAADGAGASGRLEDGENDSISSTEDEEEDLDDTDRDFVNCDDKCGDCLMRCFRRCCFERRRGSMR
jgi:hypothetical protein